MIKGHRCPFCSNNKVWKGFNDIETKFPELAKEAKDWDPSTELPGSNKKEIGNARSAGTNGKQCPMREQKPTAQGAQSVPEKSN